MQTLSNDRRRGDVSSLQKRVFRLGSWFLIFTLLGAGCVTKPVYHHSGPWDLDALSKPPAVAWGATNGAVQEL